MNFIAIICMLKCQRESYRISTCHENLSLSVPFFFFFFLRTKYGILEKEVEHLFCFRSCVRLNTNKCFLNGVHSLNVYLYRRRLISD